MINGIVNDKLKAVSRAVRDLDRASKTLGRIGIRNARRSLWARIRALQEECDVQYTLPKKKIEPPSLEEKARRMTTAGFDREFAYPSWWLKSVAGQSEQAVDRYFKGLAQIVASVCAHEEIPVPRLEASQLGLLNLPGSGVLGLKELTFAGLFRQLAKWSLFHRQQLAYRSKRRPGQKHPPTSVRTLKDAERYTDETNVDVNLKMIELLKLTSYLPQETQ